MSMKRDQSQDPPARSSRWPIVALVVWTVGVVAGFGVPFGIAEKDSAHVESALAVVVVVALLLAGVAQLIRAMVHGGNPFVDGCAKIVSVGAWALGACGAVFKAIDGTNAPGWVVLLAVVVAEVPALVLGLLLLRWMRTTRKRPDEPYQVKPRT
ncbi:hypothetical protein [Brachybacterium paraconglomeratum]|uniref:hypothetical protein n=1 Tax=Brachybacterium paraconglomeratum TaxID=173362 RepID=UPI0021A621C2|nr:hypothetical protein [Brachybacterium paraconglomeratum]MCT1909545.1 hypothetical protein [Brachybacterium paraconglomeratum]